MNDKELIGTIRLVRSPITYRFERATILEIQAYSPGRGLLVQFDDESHRLCFKSIGPNGVKLGVVWLMQATIDNDTLAIPS